MKKFAKKKTPENKTLAFLEIFRRLIYKVKKPTQIQCVNVYLYQRFRPA